MVADCRRRAPKTAPESTFEMQRSVAKAERGTNRGPTRSVCKHKGLLESQDRPTRYNLLPSLGCI